jgi:hypothetical protein
MRPLLVVALFVAASALPACSTYKDDLARSQRAFEENRHEHALAVLRMLEPDTRHLDESERARYAYLRGMTDYRIGYKSDARHWLAVAKAMDEKHPGVIPADWRSRADQSLAELNTQVWSGGMEALANTKHRPAPKVKREPEREHTDAPVEEEEEQVQPAKPPAKKKKPITEEED